MFVAVATQPTWYPLHSAVVGSAFGALLSTIAIAITVQLVVQPGPGDRHSDRLSLSAAPFTLALLLLATYLYIVLAGIPEDRSWCTVGRPCDMNAAIAAGAAIFNIAGTVLALGALSFIFTLSCVVRELAAPAQARAGAAAFFGWAAIVVAFILVVGYETAFRTTSPSDDPLNGRHPHFWLIEGVVFAGPIGVGLLLQKWRRLAQERKGRGSADERAMTLSATDSRAGAAAEGRLVSQVDADDRREKQRAATWPANIVMGFGFALPASISMLLIHRGPAHASEGLLWWTAIGSSLWFAVCTAGMIAALPTPSPADSTPNATPAPPLAAHIWDGELADNAPGPHNGGLPDALLRSVVAVAAVVAITRRTLGRARSSR